MARLAVLLVLMIAVVAEGSALLEGRGKPQIADAQVGPNAVGDLLRKTAALDHSIASLDARLKAVEGAQAGIRAKTDDVTKLLSDLEAHPPKRQKSGNPR